MPHAPARRVRTLPTAGRKDAVLSVRPVIPAASRRAALVPPAAPSWQHRVSVWFDRIELVHDLAEGIGTRRWYRGMATLLVLSGLAIACWPGLAAVEAAPAIPDTAQVRDQFLSQTITPLAFGADSGRHMGASPLVHPLSHVPERPRIEMVSTLAQGDSFQGMLRRVGLGAGDISRVSQLVSATVPLDRIEPGTQFDITLGRRPAAGDARPLDALHFRARFDLDLALERRGEALSLIRQPIRVDATPLRIRGTVGSSLYRSARNAGAPVSAIQSYLQAIDKQVSLDDLDPHDQFDMIVDYKRSARGDHVAGNLLYAGLIENGRTRVQMMRWGREGDLTSAPGLEQGTSVPIGAPVAGHITSTYGPRRHPILGFVRMHAGIDYGAPYGSPIHAVRDGVVTFSGRHGGHGNYVRLDHGGGIGTGYGHMSRIAVRVGMHVQTGQIIGYVGSTGLSTGPHLHFEVYQNGHTVNPATMKFLRPPRFDPRERDAFRAQLAHLLQVEPGAALMPIAPEAPLAPTSAALPRREIDKLGAAQVN